MTTNIRNTKQQTLFLNFYNIDCPVGRPSDIDMFYLGNDFVVLGEIKNELGELTEGQEKLLENLVKRFNCDAYLLFIKHKKYVENGDTEVDIAQARIDKVLVKGIDKLEWQKPKRFDLTVGEYFDGLFKFYGMK